MTSKRDQEAKKKDGRLIPIHIRFVPKDVWLRIHVDTRSTIGSVKDVVLEKLKMPPYDPTVMPGFYEEARYAMIKPAFTPNEAKAFPKAFIARCPKRTVGEVLDAEMKKNTSKPVELVKSSPSKFNSRLKSKGSLTLARELLGGEPGDGGMGSMNYVGQATYLRSPNKSQESFVGETSRNGDSLRLVSSPSSSSTASKLLNSVRGTRSPRLRESLLSLSAAAREVRHSPAMTDNTFDSAEALGSDIYNNALALTLPGNAEAKRKEEEAMILLNKAEGNSSMSSELSKILDGTPTRLSNSNSSPSLSSSLQEPSIVSLAEQADLDLGDSTSDEESEQGHDREATSKSLLSSGSDASSISHLQKLHPSSLRSKSKGHARGGSLLGGAATSTSDVDSVALSSVATERGRSGTIIAGPEAKYGIPSPVHMKRVGSDMSTGSAGYSMKLVPSSSSTSNRSKEQLLFSSEDSKVTSFKSSGKGNTSETRIDTRLAGIHLDEISSWRDAQHPLSRFFCVYSFSNGHMLEDWRTVAALRIRPFELLEIQHADCRSRMRLPRGAGFNAHRSSSTTLLELDGPETYTEACSEGWCYIFKRNSGSNKAQRAGLGVWKLRYLVICRSRLVIYRKKPTRSSINDLQNTLSWNISNIECVFTERADGGTRPALMPLQGLSSDIVTLSFAAETAPSTFVNNETPGWVPSAIVSLSIRFVSQLDTCAFFNTFARAATRSQRRDDQVGAQINEWRRKAVTRATIAGRGGVVLPGRAGRAGGRNAYARSRLRPTAVSRDFDDADRWSSQSDIEDYDKVASTKGFQYTDIYGSNGNKSGKDGLFDPSYDVKPIPTRSSLQSQETWSPRGAPSLLLQPDERKREPRTSSSTEQKNAPSLPVDESKNTKLGRSRGFSFAKAARKAISPSDSSNRQKTQQQQPLATPTSPNFAETNDKDNRERRRSTQPDIHSLVARMPDSPTRRTSFNASEIRPMTSNRRASQGFSIRHTQQTVQSSPIASVGGRQRSYTLASPTSSPASSKRSLAPKQSSNTDSSSSSGNNFASFHWPFRSSNAKTISSADAKTNAAGGVAEVGGGGDGRV